MKKAKQLHKKQNKMSPTQTAQFLEDFRKIHFGIDKKTKAISIRVPENVLNAFKVKANSEGKKYQAEIVRLMRDWAMKN